MTLRTLLLTTLLACSTAVPPPKAPAQPAVETDPDGPHRAAVAALVQPYVDAGIVNGLVVGLYDAGTREIYGFGEGPGGAPPTGATLYELGSVTKVYTGLLLADAVQRREVSLEDEIATLLPPGVTVPTRDKVSITLRQLALHTSGLPRLPPSLAQVERPDPYAGYGEDQLFQDLLRTQLVTTPGTVVSYSNYGTGLLGYALGRRIGGGYAAALTERVLAPLGLSHTHVGFPEGAPRAEGTTYDGTPAPPWTFDALAGAGALVSNVRDQLTFLDAELDAYAGGKLPLRAPMRLTQEPQEEFGAPQAGIGWLIDREGRYWHNGGTGGFHSFVAFDPKNRRGVVVLASTSTSLVDRIGSMMFELLAGQNPQPPVFPSTEQLQQLVGTYDLLGSKVLVKLDGGKLYIEGPGEPPIRLLPLSELAFFLEPLQGVVAFQKDGDQVSTLLFSINGQNIAAPRVE